MSPRTFAVALLLAISAYSAFPSPFYGQIASSFAGGSWAAAVAFAVHGAFAMLAMTWVQRLNLARVSGWHLICVALLVDGLGGLALAVGAFADNIALLLLGRAITGLALGLATPMLSVAITPDDADTRWVTMATLGGVGLGALISAGLAAAGLQFAGITLAGGVGIIVLAVMSLSRSVPLAPSAPHHTSAGPIRASDRLLVIAAMLTFVANGVLGLFSSLVPASIASMIGGGSALAGIVAGITLVSAGAARATMRLTLPQTTGAIVIGGVAGALLLIAALSSRQPLLAVASGTVLGAACGLTYDLGLALAARNDPDAGRLDRLARAQRSGQLGLVLPALIYPFIKVA